MKRERILEFLFLLGGWRLGLFVEMGVLGDVKCLFCLG